MNHIPDSTIKSPVERRIEELKAVSERDPLHAASGRARFLREAEDYRQAISPAAHLRRRGGIFSLRNEKLSVNALVILLLAAALLLGGGVTVAAAQDDLPNQSLYQLKLWTENATLAMNGDPQEQADLLMTMAQTRVQEMAELVEMGITPPDRVQERLQQHLDQALRLAANIDEAKRDKLLLKLHDQLQTQDQIMEKLQLHGKAESESQLTQTRQMLQNHLQLVDKGLAEPQGFQNMIEKQLQHGLDKDSPPLPNQDGAPGIHQDGERGKPSDTPGGGNGNGNGNNGSNNSNGGPPQDKPNKANGGNGSGNDTPGDPQGGMDGQSGNGPGEGEENK